MCQFKSAIVIRDATKKGGFQLLMSPWTEHHSELITIFKLKDDARLKFARVEFTPKCLSEAYLPETYSLRIDEERTPEWFDSEMKEAVANKMRSYIKSIIVSGDCQLLVGGQFIIAPTAKIEAAHSMVINVMCGGTLTAMWGGTLTAMRGGTLTAMWGGTLTAMRGGTLTAMWGGTLTAMWGGTLTAIKKRFNGLLGKVSKAAKIITDNRKK